MSSSGISSMSSDEWSSERKWSETAVCLEVGVVLSTGRRCSLKRCLSRLLVSPIYCLLSSSPRCANVFKSLPLVAFRRTCNLSDILVRSKLRTVTQTNVSKGSFRCGKVRCVTCSYITDGRTNYTFSATGETRPIPNHIDCDSKNLIYMVHCRHCNKQYISLLVPCPLVGDRAGTNNI